MIESVAPDGSRQLMSYDASNPEPCARRNLLKVEIAAAPANVEPSRILQQVQYDPQYQLPVRVTDEAGEVTHYRYDFDTGNPAATGR